VPSAIEVWSLVKLPVIAKLPLFIYDAVAPFVKLVLMYVLPAMYKFPVFCTWANALRTGNNPETIKAKSNLDKEKKLLFKNQAFIVHNSITKFKQSQPKIGFIL
jgi:hypothetical protein